MKKKFGLLLATLLVASTAAFAGCDMLGGNSSSEESTTSSVTTSSPADSSSVAPATYTVTFNSDGGSDVAAATVTEGEKAAKPTDPTKTGYTFDGWYLGETAFDFENVAITTNVTLTAKWNVVTYTATVSEVGGTATPVEFTVENKAEKLAAIVAMLPQDDDQFDYEWSAALPTELALNNDQAFTYTKTTKTYTVTVNLNNGANAIVVENVPYGTTYADAFDGVEELSQMPTKTGYTYAGIMIGETPFDEEDTVTGNVTIDVQWTINKYTVKFVNGSNVLFEQSLDYGTEIIFMPESDPTKEADPQYTYTFSGWSPAYQVGVTTVPVDGVTFEAQFTSTEREYTVQFVNDDGSVIKEEKVKYGAAATEPEAPTSAKVSAFEQTFTGWDKAITAIGESGNQTYTAQYQAGAAKELVSQATTNYFKAASHPNKTDYTYEVGGSLAYSWNTDGNNIFAESGIAISNALIAEAKAAGYNYLEIAFNASNTDVYLGVDASPVSGTFEYTNETYAACVNGKEYIVIDVSGITTNEGYTKLLNAHQYAVLLCNAKFVKDKISTNVNYASPLMDWSWSGGSDMDFFVASQGSPKMYWAQSKHGTTSIQPYLGVNVNREAADYTADVAFIGSKVTSDRGVTTVCLIADFVRQAKTLGYDQMKVTVFVHGYTTDGSDTPVAEGYYWANCEQPFEKVGETGKTMITYNHDGLTEVTINIGALPDTAGYVCLPVLQAPNGSEAFIGYTNITFAKSAQ